MNTVRRAAFYACALLLVLGSGDANLRAEVTQLQGGTWSGEVTGLGESFNDSSGGLHLHQLTADVTVTGDLHGTGTLFQISNTNTQGTGGVSAWLELNLTLDAGSGGPLTGTFAGHFGFSLAEYWVNNEEAKLKGSGEFEGMVLHFFTSGPFGGPFTWTGYIESP